QAGRTKDELPAEVAAGAGRFAVERFGQRHGAEAAGQIALVLGMNTANMLAQFRLDRFRKHGAPIFAALAMPDDDDIVAAVEVFDSQVEAFQQAQAGAILQQRDQPVGAVELGDDALHFLGTQDKREALGPLGPHNAFDPARLDLQYPLVEEKQGAECLVLRGGAAVRADRQVRQESVNLSRAHLGWMVHAMKADIADDPVDISLLSAATVVAQANGGADPVEE